MAHGSGVVVAPCRPRTSSTSHPSSRRSSTSHRDRARGDERGYEGYRGHVYRVLNLARAIVPDVDDRDDKLAVAASFHDLEAFDALDYLAPSIRAQDAWLERDGRAAWGDELAVDRRQAPSLQAVPRPPRGARRGVSARGPGRRQPGADHGPGIPRAHVVAVRKTFDVGTFFTRVVPRAVLRNIGRATRWTRCRMRGRGGRSRRPGTRARTARRRSRARARSSRSAS